MADGLIPNDAANNPFNNQLESPPAYDQVVSSMPGQQRCYPMYSSPSPYPSGYGPPPPQPQYGSYSKAYPNPQQPQAQMYPSSCGQPFYGNPQQPQYPPQAPQYDQPDYTMYGAPQQQPTTMYQSGYQQNFTADAKLATPNQYGAPHQQPSMYQSGYQQNFTADAKFVTPNQYGAPQQQQLSTYQYSYQPITSADAKVGAPTQTQPSGQVVLYQPPPEYLGSEITNVPFTPVKLHGDDEHHAVKAIHEISTKQALVVAAIAAIVGTYLMKRRDHEQNRIQNSMHIHGPRGTTQEVALYNHMMDRLEGLSGQATTKHHLHHSQPVAVQPWTEAIQPHRRAIFADLYNSNPNVRAFCSGGWSPTDYPVLDDWALGRRTHNLSFQRAGQRAPNWNAARHLLSQVRTVILLDDSSFMLMDGHSAWNYNSDNYGSNASRWDQAKNLLAGIAPLVSQYNRHGIDIHFLNEERPLLGLRTRGDVIRNFKLPCGMTPTGRRVNEILDGYMCALRYNRSLLPLNLVVITDGEAQDEEILHWAIEEHVTKIVHRGFPEHQFGIEFLQVGDDFEATEHLQRLEEEVSRHHMRFQRDVVGVTPATRQRTITPDKLLGIILSGIDARMNGYMRQRGIDV